MQLVTFRDDRGERIGVLREGRVVDLSVAAPELPRDMIDFVAAGVSALETAREALAGASGDAVRTPDEIELLAPVPRPARNIFCVGKNYHAHVEEVQRRIAADRPAADAVPQVPVIFTKAPSCVIGPGAPIPSHLDPTDSVDYEAEIGVVIGEGGLGIRREDAWNHVYGYTLINDVTSRRIQRRHEQWFLGKSIDGFCPMGPTLVTADEIEDPLAIVLECRVNGELRQHAPVEAMIFDIPTVIETLSRTMRLEPGDVIATGTPAGVGFGYDPPKYLVPGDTVVVSASGLGELRNPVA